MSRTPIPFHAPDISDLARNLVKELGEAAPSHLSLLNMLARSAGFRNFQHLRSAQAARGRLETKADADPVDYRLMEKLLHQCDAQGRLQTWPSRRAVQDLGLWMFWAALPASTPLAEREISALLNTLHHFGDAAMIRRNLVGAGLVTRKLDGSEYLRVEQEPTPTARALLARLNKQRKEMPDA
ncbi:DUF2087 domain-containing protein [Sulfitobacter sp. S190]|uniref:DUF2087 domain-containing protein n=1 Tax=Sulfitobacter sp. S190 TaxID=2867022 RepID=UPI0021A88CC1|nr:DUF2087 domain-containing protein [Sulfitobacter sp. S190]UWR23284.1 DUF2087 domain-containing protein [Sulfitobacter sp. S190]